MTVRTCVRTVSRPPQETIADLRLCWACTQERGSSREGWAASAETECAKGKERATWGAISAERPHRLPREGMRAGTSMYMYDISTRRVLWPILLSFFVAPPRSSIFRFVISSFFSSLFAPYPSQYCTHPSLSLCNELFRRQVHAPWDRPQDEIEEVLYRRHGQQRGVPSHPSASRHYLAASLASRCLQTHSVDCLLVRPSSWPLSRL